MIQGKTMGVIVLIYCFILISTNQISSNHGQLEISIKGVYSGSVIFDTKMNLIYSPTFFNNEKDRLPLPITFPKKYSSQMILQFSAKLDGNIIPNSTQKIKLSRIFFQYKQPNFIEELLGKTLQYYAFFKDAEEVYPQNVHIKIEYIDAYQKQSVLEKPQLIYQNRIIGSIQDYKSIENAPQQITVNFIPSLKIVNNPWLLQYAPFMKIANNLIETHILISENRGESKILQELNADYKHNYKQVSNTNNTLIRALLSYSTLKINSKHTNGFYQTYVFDFYLKVMEKYKKLVYFDENGYYTIKYSIEYITKLVNGLLQIIFTYVVLSNLYQNYENHVGVSLIPALLFTFQLIPAFLQQQTQMNYECIFYVIAIGIPCFSICFGKNKRNKLYEQNCKRNDTIFIFMFAFIILMLLFGSIKINKDQTQSRLLFMIVIEIIANYFVVISMLSQIYQNYKMKSVRHLKKSYIAIVCSFALIDDLRLIIAESKGEVLSLLLADILVVILLLQLTKYNDLGEGTKQHAFRAYLQMEKQRRKKYLKDIREKLKNQ